MKILGKEVKILFKTKRGEDGSFRDITPSQLTIYVNPKLSKDDQAQVLLHECMHAILHISGHSLNLKLEKEESIVQALEYGLMDCLETINKLKNGEEIQ